MKKHLIISHFEKHAKFENKRLAIVCDNEEVSYYQLNQRANIIANYLIKIGVKQGTLVAILLPRSIDFIAVVLAILKVGGCYVPIDPTLPEERIRIIIKDAGVSFLTTFRDIDIPSINIINIDVIKKTKKDAHKGNLPPIGDKNDKMYVIYTSGSTGTPKGAVNTYKGFMNLVEWYASVFRMSSEDRILIYTSLSFDLTQKNIFGPLIKGATIFLIKDGPYNPDLIVDNIYKSKITWINSTPSAFYPLIEDGRDLKKLSSLRYVFVGGEPLFVERIAHIRKDLPNLNIVNTYGPTECADVCSFYLLWRPKF